MPSEILDAMREHSYVSVPSEVRAANIASSLRRALPALAFGQPNVLKAAVVAGGPSAAYDIEEIRNFDGYVIAINGAHDWLVGHNILPDAVIVVDAAASMAGMFKNPQKETTYLICSSCDPSVFDALKDNKVILWHAAKKGGKNGTVAVCTGPSAVTTAPYLLYMIGYRGIHFFGVDSSLDSAQSHVYSDGIPSDNRTQMVVDGDVYLTTGQFILQATYLWDLNKILKDDLKMTIHGYGLAKAIFDNNGDYEII